MENYYLDESGNTGDLTLAMPKFDFEGQPFFILSCFGYDDQSKLENEVSRLKVLYNVQGPELKFKSIRTKPKFMCDLLDFLEVADSPILIEATDKRYSICTIIIETLIMPSICAADWSEEARFIKNHFSERLYSSLPNEVLTAFCHACHNRTKECLGDAFHAILDWAESMPSDDVMTGLLMFLRDTKSDFEDIDGNDAEALKRFLPIPDATRHGKPIHILPHVFSLLHIYGRLNRQTKGRLSDIILYHDEQVQFDQALRDGMALAESKISENLPLQPQADFTFVESAKLNFSVSDRSVGVQVADLLAGSIAFCLKELNKRQPELSEQWKGYICKLLNTCDKTPCTGVNIVARHELTYTFHELRHI